MSILNWFAKKQSVKAAPEEERSSVRHVVVAASPKAADTLRPQGTPPAAIRDTHRKTLRFERRQLLFDVVRDAMIGAGVLAASYKFKVLSLDAAGCQHLIIMDISPEVRSDAMRLAEIEASMVQRAKMRHGLVVSGVYWRVNDDVTVGQSPGRARPVAPVPEPAFGAKASCQPESRAPAHKPLPRYEPLQHEEVVAFKRALASAGSARPVPASKAVVKSGRRNRPLPDGFEDTQLVDPDEPASPLSITQYGHLN